MDGGVAVEQFAGAAVDVIGAATQQNQLQALSGVPNGACETVGKGDTPLVRPSRAMDERRQTAARFGCDGPLISGAVPHGSLARIACRSGLHVWLLAP